MQGHCACVRVWLLCSRVFRPGCRGCSLPNGYVAQRGGAGEMLEFETQTYPQLKVVLNHEQRANKIQIIIIETEQNLRNFRKFATN